MRPLALAGSSARLDTQMRRRDLVLLLGDSLGDLNMAKGLKAEQVLTVGFLNDKASVFLYCFLLFFCDDCFEGKKRQC